MRVDLLPRERLLITLGVVLAIALLASIPFAPRSILGGWLGAMSAFSAVAAGAACLLIAMRLIPGAWVEELRLSAEAASLLTPFALAAFIPVMLGLGAIYPWAGGAGLHDFKALWLAPVAWSVRSIVRFLAIAWVARRIRRRRGAVAAAAGGAIVLPLLGSAVAVDWFMSLDPEFASSGFGLQFLMREVLIAFAAIILLRLSIGRPPPRLGVAGGVLLTLLLLWAYLQYMPFLISWSTNLPPLAGWYLDRGSGGWGVLAAAWGALGGGAILLLLFRAPRTRPGWLRAVAGMVLVSQLLETAWVALPAFEPGAIAAYLIGLCALGAFAGGAMPAALRRRVRARCVRQVEP